MDGLLGAIGAIFEATSGDVKLEQQFCIGVDGWAAEWEHAVLGRNGKTLESDNAFVYRFAGGRIAEMWMFLGADPGAAALLRLPEVLRRVLAALESGDHAGGVVWGEEYRRLARRARASRRRARRLATAAYMTGREQEGFAVWGRAHQRCLDVGDLAGRHGSGSGLPRRSGSRAISPGVADGSSDADGSLTTRPSTASSVDSSNTPPVCARICVDGDISAAHAAFGRAAKIGERFRDPELLTLARMGEGRCLIYLGEIAEGMSLLDEAMVSVEAREIPPMAVGDAYCTVIDAVHELFDIRRCEQWTESFTRWCDAQHGLVLYRGHCLLHRADLLMLHGAWSDGVSVAKAACAGLSEPMNAPTLGGAHYIEAELHRLRGEFAMAERAYERANSFGCQPQPGMALLRLAQGRVDVAAAQLRRRLAESDQPIDRARVLCAASEILVAADDVDGARAAADELSSIATQLGSPLLRAHAELATGSALLACRRCDRRTGRPAPCCRRLDRAAGAHVNRRVPGC